jgi:hypothetical protein
LLREAGQAGADGAPVTESVAPASCRRVDSILSCSYFAPAK